MRTMAVHCDKCGMLACYADDWTEIDGDILCIECG